MRHASLFVVPWAFACHHTEAAKSEATPPLAAATAATSVAALPPPAPSSAPPSSAAPASNDELKAELQAFLTTRQACAAPSDCTNLSGSCPFGCTIPVAKGAEADAKKKLAELVQRQEQQGSRCVYRCAAPEPPACVSGRCTAP